VGTFVAADLLSAGHDVLIIERNPDLVARLRPSSDVELFLGDACEVSDLDEAGIRDANVMVAATGEDQVNLVISLLAKQEFNVPRVVARINEPRNKWLFNESWGVDVSVSTPHILTALIEEAVSVGSLVRLLEFEGGEAQLIEVTLAAESPAVDKPILELGVPRDATVVAVLRGGHVIVPRGDTVLAAGDEVLALVTSQTENAMKEILVGVDAGPSSEPRNAPDGPS
jgi:trk system potassium uptake protein